MIGYTNSSSSSSTKIKKSILTIIYTPGCVCTITNGLQTFIASNTSGQYSFSIIDGYWLINCSKEDLNISKTVYLSRGENITISLFMPIVFGIRRDQNNSSPIWTRTNDSIGYTATASRGTTPGFSSFDDKPIYSQIVRETINNDVMVKIPKFWFQRKIDKGIETIKITNQPLEGFQLHRAFIRYGVEKDYIYIGAYETGTNFVSQPDVFPLDGTIDDTTNTLSTFRTGIRAKGSGWEIVDSFLMSAIRMLVLVEFATNNTQQVIGLGNVMHDSVTSSDFIKTGTCDTVPNLTGTAINDGFSGVVWRGIENLWGNSFEILDGSKAVISNTALLYYITNNPTNFNSDSNTTNYTRLSYNIPGSLSRQLITLFGYDLTFPEILLPTQTIDSSTKDIYYTDTVSSTTNTSGYWEVRTSGRVDTADNTGLFYTNMASSFSGTTGNARMMYIPT